MPTLTVTRCLFSSLVLLLTICASPLHAADSLRFSIDNRHSTPVPPFSWYNICSEQFQGFNHALYRRLADDLAMPAEFIEAEFSNSPGGMTKNSLQLIDEKKSDFALIHPIFAKANKNFVFGKEPALSIDQVLLLPSQSPEIAHISALENMSGVGVNIKPLLHGFKNRGILLSLKKVATLEDAAKIIADNDADYWITSKFIAQHLINSMNLHKKVKLSNLKIGTTAKLYMITNSNINKNILLLNRADALIKTYHQTGYIDFLKTSVMHTWLANKACLEKH